MQYELRSFYLSGALIHCFKINIYPSEEQTPMLQSEIDWTVLLKGQPGFGPRFFGGAPMAYPVQFPLGRPTADNLQAICLHGDHRPRYPASYFPASGFSSQFRKGRAVNNAEFWFSTCCEGNQTWERDVTMCCATQAWELSIKAYCKEEFSIKTSHYHCCKLMNRNRLNCFHNNAPNPNYEPTEEIPVAPLPSTNKFNFDPNTCQRYKTDINFPPGRPTADTIESLCLHQHLRPLYNVMCLRGLGYKLLSRQAKTINRMEKGFKRCCKKQDVLSCADQNWREELNRFCLDENGGRVDFQCCSSDEANDRYSCFQHISPEPQYNMTTATEELSLIKICETHNIIERK
uniref:Extracellular matrix protein 1b n=1 Tax=Mastacembelus armatus TaxID=205130 RepID=A0A3Q3MFW7_9TELE